MVINVFCNRGLLNINKSFISLIFSGSASLKRFHKFIGGDNPTFEEILLARVNAFEPASSRSSAKIIVAELFLRNSS